MCCHFVSCLVVLLCIVALTDVLCRVVFCIVVFLRSLFFIIIAKFLSLVNLQNAFQLLTESAAKIEVAPWQNAHIIRLFLDQGKKLLLSFIQTFQTLNPFPNIDELHYFIPANVRRFYSSGGDIRQ